VITEDEEVFVTGRRAAGSVVARQLLARSNGTPTDPSLRSDSSVFVLLVRWCVQRVIVTHQNYSCLAEKTRQNIPVFNLLWVNMVEIPTNYDTYPD
jgi:hypothetical protein